MNIDTAQSQSVERPNRGGSGLAMPSQEPLLSKLPAAPAVGLHQVDLTAASQEGLFREATETDWPDLDRDPVGFRARALTGAYRAIDLIDLAAFRGRRKRDVGVLITGTPIARDVPPTPSNPADGVGLVPVACRVFAMVASVFGTVFALKGEGQSRLIHCILPVESTQYDQISTNSVRLELHAEAAFTEASPDLVALACLRQPVGGQGAATTVVSIDAVLGMLSFEDKEVLRGPHYRMKVDDSVQQGAPGQPDAIDNLPILMGSDLAPTIHADLGESTAMPGHYRAERALAKFKRAVDAAAETGGVRLKEGEIFVLDNRVAMHGRAAYDPSYDEASRWLLRTYVALSPSSVRGEDEKAVVFPVPRRPGLSE